MNELIPEFLRRMPSLAQSLLFLGVLMVAAEIGYRVGRARRRGESEEDTPESWTFEGAMVGLLGLLLAFTYSFAATHFEARRTATLEEANAIGTAYLRAGLTPEPIRGELKELLHRYARLRVITQEQALDPVRFKALLDESEALQDRMWTTASGIIKDRTPTPVDALVLASLNEVIDAHGRRLAATRERLPTVIIGMIFAIGTVALGLAGFASGYAGRRNLLMTTTLALSIAAVTYVILDLDHPRTGQIRVSQQSLIDAIRSMEAEHGAK